jgi:prepilin signal peptidase PulO-like enzyme (type II secretory pathway)
MLWLGSMFLCVAMFTVIWHAAVDLEQTWVWYVSGIVMGVLILTMFALFEKRREQLKALASELQTWEE